MRHWMNRMHGGRAAFWGAGPGGFGGWGRPGMGPGGDMEAKLAEALGISVEQLRAAQEKAAASSIDEAVASGELAPKQAERMLAWLKLRNYVDLPALAAQALDMTPEQLWAELESGKSPWDLLAERNLDIGTALQKLMTAGKAKLQQAVADGVITQAQADEIAKMRGPQFGPGPMGGPFGFGPMGPLGRGRCGRGPGFRGPWSGPWRSEPQPPEVI